MSLKPLAPALIPHYQSSSDFLISLCNSTTMSLPLAQLFCRKSPRIIPSHASSINQPITDGTFILLLIQLTNQSKQDAAAHQPPAGPSSLLSLPLQHQANCLQAIHKTIQQFNQHLKAEHLDRQTLQLIPLQLQNIFALLTATCLSPRLKQSPPRIFPLKAPPPVLYLTLTLLHLPSHFPALMKQNFIVLPRWALRDHPERKQTIL